MAHRIGKSPFGKHRFSEFMDLRTCLSRAKLRFSSLVGASHSFPRTVHLFSRLPHEHRARHVGTITTEARAEIHYDRAAARDARITRKSMRACRVSTRCDDRGKCEPFSASIEHEVIERALNLCFRHARLDEVNDEREARISDGLRLSHEGDLESILARTQTFDESLALDKLRRSRCIRERLGEHMELAQDERVFDRSALLAARSARKQVRKPIRMARPLERHLDLRTLRSRLERFAIA